MTNNKTSNINEEQFHFICKLLSLGYKRIEILKICSYAISYDIIKFIHERKFWEHISKDYIW